MRYKNISKAVSDLGYMKHAYDECVFNKTDSNGTQITVVVHVDDLLISSVPSDLIKELEDHLEKTYRKSTMTE